jgi:thiol-disulfide isomerase/thioredoxin
MSRYILLTLLAVCVMGTMACAGGSPISPNATSELTGQFTVPDNHTVWAVFDLGLDLTNGTAEIIWDRTAEMHVNVTAKTKPPQCGDCVVISDTNYNATTHRFQVSVVFKNPTAFTGYDVRAVISNAGGNKFLMNSDGVTSVWGSPMQYRAINVNPGRAFVGGAVQGRMFDFYLPGGENFKTLSYIIDANVPGNVVEPLAENGLSDPLVNNDFSTTYLKCTILDHQNDLKNVVCDLMPLGGSPQTIMYDDGAHNDGAAGDKTYGVTGIKTSVTEGIYMISVFPFDNALNMGWGQIPVSVQKTSGGPNDDPIIQDIKTDKTTANGSANEKIKITVTAVDPNGDPISYQFSGSGSFVNQIEGVVYWKPSTQNRGKQDITCKVLDDKGGSAQQVINLWSTNLGKINGATQGKIPAGTLTSVLPDATLHMDTDFEGQVLYCNFWATWCGYCVAEMPELTTVYNKYKANPDYVHILINEKESESQVMNFINSNSYACTYWAMDSSGSYFNACNDFNQNSNGIPQHILFDRDGICRWAHLGGLSSVSELEDAIEQLL